MSHSGDRCHRSIVITNRGNVTRLHPKEQHCLAQCQVDIGLLKLSYLDLFGACFMQLTMQRCCKRQKRNPSWGRRSSAFPISLMRLTHLCLDSFTSAQQLTALACVEVSCVTLGLIMEAVDLLQLWWMQVSPGSLSTPYWIWCFSDRIISQSWCFSEQTPQIYSLWYNSRLQHKPEVIHREVHHPTCCLSPHLRLSLSLCCLSFFFYSSTCSDLPVVAHTFPLIFSSFARPTAPIHWMIDSFLKLFPPFIPPLCL